MERCARRWGLELGPPFAPSYAWVAPAVRRDGGACVLKLGLEPGPEAAALRAYGGDGAVRLLDEDGGALLLERLAPGAELATLGPGRDDEATAIVAGLLARLWREPPAGGGGLTPLAAYGADLEAAVPAGPLTAALLERGRAVFAALLASASAGAVLLHGDLHHHNVLSAGRSPWLAIDPHGLSGDPGYDVAPLLYNPLTEADPGRVAERRVRRLAAELGLDRDRLRAWGFAGAVLSEAWTAGATGRPDGRALSVARALWVSEP